MGAAMNERAGVRMVKVSDLRRGDVVYSGDALPLYEVERVSWRGTQLLMELRRPDGSTFGQVWEADEAAATERAIGLANLPRSIIILGGNRGWPVEDVREMAREVLRYLVAVEDALPDGRRMALPADLRASAYGCLRVLAGSDDGGDF